MRDGFGKQSRQAVGNVRQCRTQLPAAVMPGRRAFELNNLLLNKRKKKMDDEWYSPQSRESGRKKEVHPFSRAEFRAERMSDSGRIDIHKGLSSITRLSRTSTALYRIYRTKISTGPLWFTPVLFSLYH